MKKRICNLLLISIIVLTSFAFKTSNETYINQIEPNLYQISIPTGILTEADVLSLRDLKASSDLDGAGVFKTIKLFKTKIAKDAVSEVLTRQEQKDCPCDDEDVPKDQLMAMKMLIAKYK